jgi:hypothetical protein
VLPHSFAPLYQVGIGECSGEKIKDYEVVEAVVIPSEEEDALDKTTLDWCSTQAREAFVLDKTRTEINLPCLWPPRLDINDGKYKLIRADVNHFSFVHPDTIKTYVVPFLRDLERFKSQSNMDEEARIVRLKEGNAINKLPQFQIPETVEDRIHLYNCMLHLGILPHFKEPLIKKLCEDVKQNKLKDCHLELLEMTVGRLNAYAVPILDPVLCAFTGSFGLRDEHERLKIQQLTDENGNPISGKLRYARQKDHDGTEREVQPWEERVIPPQLPVLGHCLKHWSYVRDGEVDSNHKYPLDWYVSPEVEKVKDTEDYDMYPPDYLDSIRNAEDWRKRGEKRKAGDAEEPAQKKQKT